MAYSGSTVTYGRGMGVVTATGMNTEVGKIATMLAGENAETSPLQKQLGKTAKMLSVLVLGIAAVIFVPAGRLSVSQTLPPITELSPIVISPKTEAPE